MKKVVEIIFFLCTAMCSVFAQTAAIQGLKKDLATAKDDPTRLILLNGLFYEYLYSYADSSLQYVQQEILLAKKMRSRLALSKAYIDYSAFFDVIGDYPQSLRFNLEALKLGERSKDWFVIARVYNDIAGIRSDQGDYHNAIMYGLKAKSLMERHWNPSFEEDFYTPRDCTGDTVSNYLFILSGLGETYEKFDQLDSALTYLKICNDAVIQLTGTMNDASMLQRFGNIYSKRGDYPAALKYYRSGILLATAQGITLDVMKNSLGIANVFKNLGIIDSSIFYADKVVELSKLGYNLLLKLDALNLLANIYKSKHSTDSVAKYFDLIIATKDSLFSQKKILDLQSLTFDEQRRQQEQAQQQLELKNQIDLYALVAALSVFLLIAVLLYRNNRQKQKANLLLTGEKEKVETTLAQVKELQAQLVEKEKINERLRISRELHDDIGATLSGIVLFSHLARNQIATHGVDQVEQSLIIIQESASDMVNRLSDIVWSVNPANNSLEKMIQKLDEYAREMAKAKNMRIRVDMPERMHDLQLPLEMRHQTYLLCKEAINNAIKYSKATLLELSVHHVNHTIEFRIWDNGVGFDVATVKKGNGITNMHNRAQDMGASLFFWSCPQQGTLISVQCKIP